MHITISFSALLVFHSLHANRESKTNETSKRDEVKSGSGRVQETEFLVGAVHGGGWLTSAYSRHLNSKAHVGIAVLLTLQFLEPMPLKHDFSSLRTEPDQVH